MPISQHTNYEEVPNELIVAFQRTITPARMAPYLAAAGFKQQRAVNLYLWNTMMGQSFHFPMQTLEVALRNSIASVFAHKYGDKWWRESVARNFLDERSVDELSVARKRLRRRGINPNSDEMVAGLSFGFWAAMLAPRYKPVVWSSHLMQAFPHMPASLNHQAVYDRVNRVLDLRNRIFHHEPLLGMNLSGLYSELMQLLKWICPQTQEWVRKVSSVPRFVRLKP
ncbi:hypothetical protein [Mesorhizobium sp.]|uniref:hypothetical protein n=1 Tax=Mesorhizobium sp. TaxID=1871066 RepID=UPI000FE59D74|nr:hypothetical protein [Mesorhizobium sp.]RWD33482.1 MAG: hypothetical protein EOS33_11785 [Mesorhizobium sp.]